MKIGIHQPNFIPWVGYFAKMLAADTFILLDDVQYTKNSFINRNRIRIGPSPHWVTVPVRGSIESQIREIEIDNTQNWKKLHLKTLRQYYQKAPGFHRTFQLLEDIYANDFKYLCDLNIALIGRVAEQLALRPTLVRSSEFVLSSSRTERLVDLVRQAGGDTYISGSGGQTYQEESAFAENHIKLVYLKVVQDPYPQQGEGFVPSLSILDYLFNVADPGQGILGFRFSDALDGSQ